MLPWIMKVILQFVPCKIKCNNLYTSNSVSKLRILVLLYIYIQIYTCAHTMMYN